MQFDGRTFHSKYLSNLYGVVGDTNGRSGESGGAVESDFIKTLLRPVYHRAFRIQLRARLWLDDHLAGKMPQAGLPLPPALLRYRVSESLSTEMFLRVGRGCALHIDQQVRAMGASLCDAGRVLDFGCGCGRTLRWLTETCPGTNFYGADVDADMIAWCRENLKGSTFVRNTPAPPLPFQAGYFDIVYCFSVFTHLDEPMQDLWLAELKRVLKPQGVIILSVHGERAANELDERGAETFRRSGFIHQRSRKLEGIVPEWYNTSWHSQAYITGRLERFFTDVRYTVVPDGMQDLVAARAP